ncbi:cytochrome c biogenesis protein CcdA [Pontibacillus yanchengensis]|uniref:Cytochrome c biogenesis protein CcdA n=2 Tax=Pontibacillus yanchengensis TaxID=462910 RepID=A0A6I4ZWJ4_9BACI|nr:cytochrome c biogenesis protein CcdA [Pontibacillus yanchengensis]MYL32133.1 cytochrome c biogenesis protein CcdA [Pontibacillus yanchengensis]MYL52713.1 cytochrome c biogenesis protein CcdA [Pontibacillus yanchengensis]
MTDISIFLAFGAGLLSFLSPCCLPLYPAFLSYITGVSVDDLKQGNGLLQKRSLLHTLFFLLGFSTIFIALGFSTSFLGEFFLMNDEFIRQLGSIFIVFLGFVVIGVFKPKFMMRDTTLTFKHKPAGFVGSSFVGMGYAAGWTPCTGPILAAVLAMGVSNPNQAMMYMIAYVFGFAIPFFVMSFFIGRMKWVKRYNRLIIKIGGYSMIVMGIFLFFGWMTKLTSFLSNQFFGGFTGF